jgi:phosphoribosylglycinamide formyltransferase-1
MKRIAIFASGTGTNVENIVNYFKDNDKANVYLILTNNKKAQVTQRANKFNIPVIVFQKHNIKEHNDILTILQSNQIDFIVLAGYLWLFPENIIEAYPNRIINIHPALLPKYGGKGMYGMKVHESVYQNKEKETGITIHYINEEYDKGAIITQKKCRIDPGDTPDSIAEKVHALEYEHFPVVIEQLVGQLD